MAFDGLEWPKLSVSMVRSFSSAEHENDEIPCVWAQHEHSIGRVAEIVCADEEAQQYARLFAAAPEMYAMLERITRHGRPEWGECPSDKAVGVQCQGCEWSRLKAQIDGET